jgi:YtkA-like protein
MQWAVMFLLAAAAACGRAGNTAKLTQLEQVKTGTMTVTLLSSHDSLNHGKDTFVVEFRSVPDGRLVDVGNVRGSANMPMSGTPMFGSIDVMPTAVAGQYAASGEFGMAGRWRMTIQWDGPAGQGSITFSATVQ